MSVNQTNEAVKSIKTVLKKLGVIWREDIVHWVWWHFVGARRVRKMMDEGRCPKCGDGQDSDRCICHTH